MNTLGFDLCLSIAAILLGLLLKHNSKKNLEYLAEIDRLNAQLLTVQQHLADKSDLLHRIAPRNEPPQTGGYRSS